jgi:hypothetical protein
MESMSLRRYHIRCCNNIRMPYNGRYGPVKVGWRRLTASFEVRKTYIGGREQRAIRAAESMPLLQQLRSGTVCKSVRGTWSSEWIVAAFMWQSVGYPLRRLLIEFHAMPIFEQLLETIDILEARR